MLLHLGFLDYPKYEITVKFYGIENSKFQITSVLFQVSETSFKTISRWSVKS